MVSCSVCEEMAHPANGGKRVTRFSILVLAVALLLGACAPADVPTAAPEAAPPEPLPQPTAPEGAAPAESAAPDSSAATPTARAGLEATDPTTVSLGAGKPVLLEFFAFW
jgi:hypothetical protein